MLVGKAARDAYHGRAHGADRLTLLELGAGTGALTMSLQALKPVLIECNEDWAGLLKTRYPALEVRSECATRTLRNLTAPVGLVTSIPLINNPQGDEIKTLLSQKYAEGMIKFCVLYTYGWREPLAGGRFRRGRRAGYVLDNFPPASVWVYE